jgi:tRNA 2-thiouridine synthesizing protein A
MAARDFAQCLLVDARGHRCPVPTLRLGRVMRTVRPGALVCLLADDPMARIDVPHFAAQAGFEIVELAEVDAQLTFVVRRPKRKRRAAGGKRRVAQDDSSSS